MHPAAAAAGGRRTKKNLDKPGSGAELALARRRMAPNQSGRGLRWRSVEAAVDEAALSSSSSSDTASLWEPPGRRSTGREERDEFAEVVLLLEDKLRLAEAEAGELRARLAERELLGAAGVAPAADVADDRCGECERKDAVVAEMYDKVAELQRALDQKDGARHAWRRDSRGSAVRSGKGEEEEELDLDLVLRNVSELNNLLSENGRQIVSSPSSISPTGGGAASFGSPAALSVAFYRDGFRLGRGRLRPYGEPASAAFLRDLSDGFFPAELQGEHPAGVALLAEDRRGRDGAAVGAGPAFAGEGRRLTSSRPASTVFPPLPSSSPSPAASPAPLPLPAKKRGSGSRPAAGGNFPSPTRSANGPPGMKKKLVPLQTAAGAATRRRRRRGASKSPPPTARSSSSSNPPLHPSSSTSKGAAAANRLKPLMGGGEGGEQRGGGGVANANPGNDDDRGNGKKGSPAPKQQGGGGRGKAIRLVAPFSPSSSSATGASADACLIKVMSSGGGGQETFLLELVSYDTVRTLRGVLANHFRAPGRVELHAAGGRRMGDDSRTMADLGLAPNGVVHVTIIGERGRKK